MPSVTLATTHILAEFQPRDLGDDGEGWLSTVELARDGKFTPMEHHECIYLLFQGSIALAGIPDESWRRRRVTYWGLRVLAIEVRFAAVGAVMRACDTIMLRELSDLIHEQAPAMRPMLATCYAAAAVEKAKLV